MLSLPTHIRGEGSPVVLVHGFLGTGADWDPIVDVLAPRHRCICVDLPFHGGPEVADLVDAGHILARTAAMHCDGPASLVGYSLGGRVALHAALAHPELWSAIVTLGAQPGLVDEVARKRRRDQDAERARAMRANWPAFLDAWYGMDLFAPTRRHPGFQAMVARRRRADAGALAEAVERFSPGRQRDLWPEVSRLVSWTFVAGELDTAYVAIGRKAEALGARLVILPAAGHALPTEAPQALAGLLLDALDPLPSPAPELGHGHRHVQAR